MRLGQAHRPGEASLEHRTHEATALVGTAEADQEVGSARRQRGIGMKGDIRAGKNGRTGFRNHERELQAAVLRVKRRGRERCVVVGGESSTRLRYGPGMAVDDSRLVGVAQRGERRESLRGDAVGGIEHAIEDRPVV